MPIMARTSGGIYKAVSDIYDTQGNAISKVYDTQGNIVFQKSQPEINNLKFVVTDWNTCVSGITYASQLVPAKSSGYIPSNTVYYSLVSGEQTVTPYTPIIAKNVKNFILEGTMTLRTNITTGNQTLTLGWTDVQPNNPETATFIPIVVLGTKSGSGTISFNVLQQLPDPTPQQENLYLGIKAFNSGGSTYNGSSSSMRVYVSMAIDNLSIHP